MSRHPFIAMLLLASVMSAINAQAATDAKSATNVADTKAAANASDVTKTSDAQSASSDAAAKRPAQATPKADAAGAKAGGETNADVNAKDEVKTLSGISILGNQEAPKSLVIVPWKSSEIGEMPGLSRLLDDSVQPIDKEVFMRELDYYEIRSSSR